FISPVSETVSPASLGSTVTVRTGRIFGAEAFSSLWQAIKTNIKTKALIAPDTNGDRVERSFTGPILLIIGTPIRSNSLALPRQRQSTHTADTSIDLCHTEHCRS